ncbi:MAG: amino acid ABC transporter permease [Sciscionella sp.]
MTTATADRVALPDVVAPRRHPGRWISAVIVLVLAALVIRSLLANRNIDHATIGRFLFNANILGGLETTVILAVLSQAIGTVLGLLVAILRLSVNPVASWLGWVYVWLFRGTPLLVQVLIWGNFALFVKRIDIGIPFTGLSVASYDTNTIITAFVASVLALSLNEAAYMAEIIRAGMVSVDRGQSEAARALGLSRWQALRKVVLPQAARVIVPPSGSQFINMLKMTSLVSVIAGGDLLTQAQNIAAANLRTIELLTVATFWYLVITTVASIGQAALERRLGRSSRRASSSLRTGPGNGSIDGTLTP